MDSDSGSEDNNYDDWQDEEGDRSFICPVCDAAFQQINGVQEHTKDSHSIDLRKWHNELNDYDWICFINYLRKEKPAGAISVETFHGKEEYLRPLLEDDALLFIDDEFEEEADLNEETVYTNLQHELLAAQEEIQRLEAVVQGLRRAGAEDMMKSVENNAAQSVDVAETIEQNSKVTGITEKNNEGSDPDAYFESYNNSVIHRAMLQDAVRTDAYRDAIKGPGICQGKVVLDVGCGTSILSLFAADAGARCVHAIDNSGIARLAKEIISRNGKDNKISLHNCSVEEIKPDLFADSDGKVDIIISEWMGYGLLFESMFDSVIDARNRLLRKGGIMMPDKAAMYICGLDHKVQYDVNIEYWRDVYGYDMLPMREVSLGEAGVEVADAGEIITSKCMFKHLDLSTVEVEDLTFLEDFHLLTMRDGTLSGLCVYFDVSFEQGQDVPVILETGPETTPTHWKQTILYLDQPVEVKKGDNLTGTIYVGKAATYKRSAEFLVTLKRGDQKLCERKYTL
eukprot:Clim_evm13s148 gene=Clim_evmTU13s148